MQSFWTLVLLVVLGVMAYLVLDYSISLYRREGWRGLILTILGAIGTLIGLAIFGQVLRECGGY